MGSVSSGALRGMPHGGILGDMGTSLRLPATVEGLVGQMLCIGWHPGAAGLDALRRVVAATHAGNLIAFARNAGGPAESFGALGAARAVVEERTGIRALLAADQEGGTVARFTDGFLHLPGALAQSAAVAGGRHSLEDIRRAALACGGELRAVGVDWDLAPVADVNSNPVNPVIGVRSYGDDPRAVAEAAAAFASGLAEAGVLACGKHFPGHGDTALDSHLALPRVDRGAAALEAVELVPFARLVRGGVATIMLSHVLYPALEPRPLPASLSPAIASGLLRGRMGFRGLIATDCLEMKAIADNYPDWAVQAVLAGCDILFVSHTEETQLAAHAAIVRAVREGRIAEARIAGSVARILAAKESLPPPPAAFDEKLFARGSSSRHERAARMARDSLAMAVPGSGLPPAPSSLVVDVLPKPASGAEERPAGSVSAFLAGGPAGWRTVALPPEPDGPARERALAAMDGLPTGAGVVIALHDAARRPGQPELLRAVAARCAAEGRLLGILAMRGPWEAPWLAAQARDAAPALPAPAVLCAFGYSPPAARAVAEFLRGPHGIAGRCPVAV